MNGLLPEPAALPSVFDLALLLCDADRGSEALSEAAGARPKKEVACRNDLKRGAEVLDDRRDALRDLLLSLPPRTLADVAAQVVCAFLVANRFEEFDLDPLEARREAGRLRRVLGGALPVVARAAGIDLAAIVWGYPVGRFLGEFPEMPAGKGADA